MTAKPFEGLFFLTVVACHMVIAMRPHSIGAHYSRSVGSWSHRLMTVTLKYLYTQGKLKGQESEQRLIESKLHVNSSRNILKTKKAREIKYIP